MKIKKKEFKMTEVVTESFTVCDKCQERITLSDYNDLFKFNLEFVMGFGYPEGDSGKCWELDLCQDCAEEALTLLQRNGFNTQQREF